MSNPFWALSKCAGAHSEQRRNADGVKGAKAKPKKRVTGKDDGEGDKEAPEEDTRPWIVRNWMIAVPLGVVVGFFPHVLHPFIEDHLGSTMLQDLHPPTSLGSV